LSLSSTIVLVQGLPFLFSSNFYCIVSTYKSPLKCFLPFYV